MSVLCIYPGSHCQILNDSDHVLQARHISVITLYYYQNFIFIEIVVFYGVKRLIFLFSLILSFINVFVITTMIFFVYLNINENGTFFITFFAETRHRNCENGELKKKKGMFYSFCLVFVSSHQIFCLKSLAMLSGLYVGLCTLMIWSYYYVLSGVQHLSGLFFFSPVHQSLS